GPQDGACELRGRIARRGGRRLRACCRDLGDHILMSGTMPSAQQLAEAAALLEAGQIVAFPTETVYGLGADAENPEAIARIYAAKGRPSSHPVIVHVVDGADLSYWASEV